MTDKEKQLVEDNIKLVNYFIYTYYSYLINDEDVYQLACIGLIRAAKDWEENKGSFSKYVGFKIRGIISQYLQDNNRQKRKGERETFSLDNEVGDNLSYKDIIKDNGFEDELIENTLLEDLLSKLNDIEKEYIHLYYFEDMTYQQISDLKGKSRERCRQIVTRAVKKMGTYV